MEQSLKNRLTFGPLMLGSLLLLLWLDSAAQQWTQRWHPGGIGGLGLLFTAERIRPYRRFASTGAAVLVLHAFLTQFAWFQTIAASTLAFIIVFVMLLAALTRAWDRETQGAIQRMAGTVLATMYLGGLGWFLIALRVKHSTKSEKFHGSTMTIVMILLCLKFTYIG